MPTLALIHTSMVFLNVEPMMKDLFRQIMPDVRLINIVDDAMLADVMACGKIELAVAERMCAYVQAAEKAGADAVLSLCSSLGPAIDQARPLVKIPVIKIDDAMSEQAVRAASRIGVMATVVTTLGPTCDLIQSKAQAAGKPVQVERCLVAGAFEKLMAGDRVQHDAMVLQSARELAGKVELIVFAQASMTGLAAQVEQATAKPVLTSPRLGIEYANQVLRHRTSTSAAPASR